MAPEESCSQANIVRKLAARELRSRLRSHVHKAALELQAAYHAEPTPTEFQD